VGATNIKVANMADFSPGQRIMIDTGANTETAMIATVGTAGATVVGASTTVGATVVPIANPVGFGAGTITIDSGSNAETAIVAGTSRGGRGTGASTIALTAPLRLAHAAGVQVSGTGITLAAVLTNPHTSGARVTDNLPTPGAPNKYYKRSR
jgi:non-reducing end alpha-L-arabinofuranosidase